MPTTDTVVTATVKFCHCHGVQKLNQYTQEGPRDDVCRVMLIIHDSGEGSVQCRCYHNGLGKSPQKVLVFTFVLEPCVNIKDEEGGRLECKAGMT